VCRSMLRLLQRQSEKRALRIIVWLEAHEMAQHPLTQLRERFPSACGFSFKGKPRMSQIANGRAEEDHQSTGYLGIMPASPNKGRSTRLTEKATR
jgi:hypothetical protein